jgi:hypothetical protein
MTSLTQNLARDPASELFTILDEELESVARAEKHDQGVYRSLKKLSELIGGEYGDRVIYELLQNAHDAQGDSAGGAAEVAIHLVLDGSDHGELYVANGGRGFTRENVQAVRNIANSTKEVGEGIGNKGVGFRSVEALTDDPHIYSCHGAAAVRLGFDGYCFRFARPEEIHERLLLSGKHDLAEKVAAAMPRYLAAVPIAEQPDSVVEFARRGYATVIRLPLRTAEAVTLAKRQVLELVESDAPVLLFLSRISALEISIEEPQAKLRRERLTRKSEELVGPEPTHPLQKTFVVTLGPDRRRWLLARRTLPKEGVLDAVRRSIPQEAGLKTWLNWSGEASVAVATPLDGEGLAAARLYTFLPMAADARSPSFAHLDAPFFTNISRRQARLDLPLNAYLLDAAAEISASEAVRLTQADLIPPRCVVDLAAWSADQRGRLSSAFAKCGTSLAEAPVWPTTAKSWCGLASLRAWPQEPFKVFTAARATRAGATNILSPRLSKTRAAAISALASASYSDTKPTPEELADWAEAIASGLPEPREGNERWAEFFADLALALDKTSDLDALTGRRILPDATGALRPAGEGFYIRHDGGRRRRQDGAPLPPANIARKLLVLSEYVRPRQDTVAQFQRAKLWQRYDATEILERLPSLFGDKPAPARRRDALEWAFAVWSSDRQGGRRALASADLHVETRSGWKPASDAAFSEHWTDTGRELDAFLSEAQATCADCAAAARSLLVAPEHMAGAGGRAALKEWVEFLSDAGVVDGLVALSAPLPDGPITGAGWSWTLSQALGSDWRATAFTFPHHPNTNYWREGEAWKLPGQEVVEKLSPEARRRFATLVIRHLETFGEERLSFDLARTDRYGGHQDRRVQSTPLAVFLSSGEWFPMETAHHLDFVQPEHGWLMSDRRELRFAARPPEDVGGLLAKSDRATQILCSQFGLKRWRDPETAGSRMKALGELCENLSQHDRPQLQTHYVRAWQDLLADGADLDAEVPLIIRRTEGFARLTPGPEAQTVYVADGASADLAKLLIESGEPVLAISDQVDAAAVISVINAGSMFAARPAGEADIKLLVDGEPFGVSAGDPLLVDVLPWITDALVLGHELGARALERGAQLSAILDKLQRLRLRRVSEIDLQSGEGSSKSLNRHLYRDERMPTLVVAEPFDSRRLEACATVLTDYLNQNLRTFELLLVKLAHRITPGVDLGLVAPNDDQYADALDFDVTFVREHLAAHQRNDQTKIALLLLVAGYFAGVDAIRDLELRLEEREVSRWPEVLSDAIPPETVKALLELLETTEDLVALRRELGLDYARLNRTSIALGRGSITSEPELHRAFAARKNEIRELLRDRLRRHFSASWRETEPLATYAEMRSLDFVSFVPAWAETQEAISRDLVLQHAEQLFESRLGSDPGGELVPYDRLRHDNRKAVIKLAERATPVLLAAAKNKLPATWSDGAKALADVLERGGYLDFESLHTDAEVIDLLARADLWPSEIPQTLDLAAHGLTGDDLDRERRLEKDRKDALERARNRVDFAGVELDASASDFASRFAQVAHEAFGASGWRERSSLRPVGLTVQPEVASSRSTSGSGRKMSKPPSKLAEPLRAAIGLAGELLAYEYLKAKHKHHFNETCWVSENRTSLFSEDGSIAEGCDFRVQTTDREWLYEVKATPGDGTEFELSDGEYRTAAVVSEQPSKDYRILFVQHAFDPARCRILELHNPAGRKSRENFRIVGRSSVRLRFDLA